MIEIEEIKAYDEEDALNTPWEESILLDQIEDELSTHTPPTLSEQAKEMANRVREVSLTYQPLQNFLTARPPPQ